MSLPKPIAKLVKQVFAKYTQRHREVAEEMEANPDVLLVSLLLTVRERLPDVSATLDFTVEQAVFDSHLKAARKYLGQTVTRTSK